jgi:class 3 adenylate cyclase
MLVEKTVFVFDICSSTSMMEDIQITSSLSSYAELMNYFTRFLTKLENHYNFQEYKFLGDGFILLFDSSVLPEEIYRFSEELVDVGGKLIASFIEDHMQNKVLPREGITIGVDSGILLKGKEEYIGRAINIACRLQGKLDSTDSVNRIIISQKVYSQITDPLVKAQFVNKPKVLKNVNGGKEVPCYESSPLVRKKHDIPNQNKMINSSAIEYIATSPSIIESFLNNKGKYSYRIKRFDNSIIYVSRDFNTKREADNEINFINNRIKQTKK